MSRLSERQRLFVTIGASVLLTGGLLGLILKDRTEIDGVREEISSLDQRIRAADIEIRRTREREEVVLVDRAVENRELAVLPTRQKIAGFHRNLSTFLATAGLHFQELPESQAQESGLAQGIYVTRSAISFQGDASSTLKFINMMENDPRLISVKGLKIDAGEKAHNDSTAPIQHDVELTLETYFYDPSSDGSDRVHIPNAEARLQEPKIREAIAAFQPERPETYVLRPAASRRDPLIDPRRHRPTADEGDLQEAMRAQETIVLDLEHLLDDINEKVEQEKALDKTGDMFRLDRLQRDVDDQINELRARIAQLDQRRAITIPELAQRVQTVKDRLEELRGRRPPREMTIPRDVVASTLSEVQKHFEKGEYQEVANLVGQWEQFLEGRKVSADALDLVEQISALRPRAKILSEFHSIPLRVTGTIVNPLNPSRSVALVNGRPMHIGDRLDEHGDVLLSEIGAENVVFAYQGESIPVKRKQGGAEEKPHGTKGRVQPVRASAPARSTSH